MASLEGDVMRSFALVCEVIKDQVMSDIQSAAVKGQVLGEDMDSSLNLKRLDKIVRDSVDQSTRNGMRQMQSSLKPFVRQLQEFQLSKKR